MSTLHVLSHSPFTDGRFSSCLRLLGAADGVLLCGDAVHALQPGTAPCNALQALNNPRFVLLEDAQARAVELPAWITGVDYPGFVQLSIAHDKVNTWL